MADIMEYTVDERPIYGFEILPETPAGAGRSYRGGGYFTHNDGAAWAWVSLWINGLRAVDARVLIGNLAVLPELIEEAVRQEKFATFGDVAPFAELSLTIEPSIYRVARSTGASAEGLTAQWEAEDDALLDFDPDEEEADDGDETSEEEEDGDEDADERDVAFDISVMVDGGLIAGFGVSRGGPAIVMHEVRSSVLLQFADELRDDLIAAGIVEPAAEEAGAWEEVDVVVAPPEPAGGGNGWLPEQRWAGHYLAREEYNRILADFQSYVPPGSPILEIGCGTAEGAAEVLSALGYKVTAVDTWMPSLLVADSNEDIEVDWADVCELEYEDQFAGAVAFHAFLHLDPEDLDEAFRGVWRALQKNGVFLLVLDPAQELLSAPSSPDAPGAMEFISELSHGEVLAKAREAGFEVLHDLVVAPLEDASDWEDRGKGRALILQAL